MKRITNEQAYGLIYYAIAIATAKHSAWAYSTTMEGAEPVINWATFTLNLDGIFQVVTLGVWFFWGLLAALVIDIGMYFIAKKIRETRDRNLLGLYLTYIMVVIISAYMQVMFALQHAAEFVPVEGVPAWVNAAYVWRFLIVPVSLPFMSIGYTLFVKVDEALNKPVMGVVEAETGLKRLNVKEAALFTNRSETGIRGLAASGKLQQRLDDDKKLYFYETELVPFIKR